jgi:energy-converting hydrogenase Eha subunit G
MTEPLTLELLKVAQGFVLICKIVMGVVLSQMHPPYFAKEPISVRTPRVVK